MSIKAPNPEKLSKEYSNEQLALQLESHRVALNRLAEAIDHGLQNENEPLSDEQVESFTDAVEALDTVGHALFERTDEATSDHADVE